MQENRPIPDQRKEMTSELVPQFIRASQEASLDPGWTFKSNLCCNFRDCRMVELLIVLCLQSLRTLINCLQFSGMSLPFQYFLSASLQGRL